MKRIGGGVPVTTRTAKPRRTATYHPPPSPAPGAKAPYSPPLRRGGFPKGDR
jgi:hypothetical protein